MTRDAGPLDRVVNEVGQETLDLLVGLPGADLTTLLLEVMRIRAGKRSATGVLRQYREDRFTAPAVVPADRLRTTEDAVVSTLPTGFELLTLAPVAPLGTHSALATVDQNKVVSTARGSEVAADPTNALALEAATRRRLLTQNDPKSASVVRLAASQRVVRAQKSTGRATFAHFALLGAVSAGRDTGNLAFERHHVVEHIRFVANAIKNAVGGHVEIGLTSLAPEFDSVAVAVHDAFASRRDVEIVDDPHRSTGRGYYLGLCFKVYSVLGDGRVEVGDGGFVDWTRALLGNRKERLLISGLGIERLATLVPAL
ncbi:hypothetical protein SAMN05421504_105237 [Amycolatopsis xylanica]|uniref:Uncharacterized protein n=1 Tax=Amycolatopsis xylanica TaxID=589385 RepID=A0A1H3J4R2_9PSEU|nr:hypothetical protein [Amycolatopsis xylanica]SDY34585.1 hypothetical protein SAMN05421504_105237 [Amycolatopsis xylanica]